MLCYTAGALLAPAESLGGKEPNWKDVFRLRMMVNTHTQTVIPGESRGEFLSFRLLVCL